MLLLVLLKASTVQCPHSHIFHMGVDGLWKHITHVCPSMVVEDLTPEPAHLLIDMSSLLYAVVTYSRSRRLSKLTEMVIGYLKQVQPTTSVLLAFDGPGFFLSPFVLLIQSTSCQTQTSE